MAKGTIRKLMENGFGFIKTEEGKDLFFHRNETEGVDFSSLRLEQEVEFEMGQDSKGRPQAVKVRLVELQVDNDSDDSDDDSGDAGDGGGDGGN
ncbi:cold-shock protein [Chloroflexota bacterium]